MTGCLTLPSRSHPFRDEKGLTLAREVKWPLSPRSPFFWSADNVPDIHPDLEAILRLQWMKPIERRGDWSPRPGVPVVHKDYSGSCSHSFEPEWTEERVPMIPNGEMFYSSPLDGGITLGGANGEPINQLIAGRTEYVRRKFPCGKCTDCINWRRQKYQRAALGFYRTTAVTVLGTLTFDSSWYARKRAEKVNTDVEALLAPFYENLIIDGKKLAGYDEAIAERRTYLQCQIDTLLNEKPRSELIAEWLLEERAAMLKRLRSSLRERSDWKGAKLVARLEVLEFGSRNGRIHAHLLWHWDNVPKGFVSKLKEWLRNDWSVKSRIGFIQLRKVRDDQGAAYQIKYIGKFETDGDGTKHYVASGNPLPQSSGYLDKGYERYKSSLGPVAGSHGPQ